VLSHPEYGGIVDECEHNFTVFHAPKNLTIIPDPGDNHILAVNLGENISCHAKVAGFPACSYYWFRVGKEDDKSVGNILTITADIYWMRRMT
jgi:hypothetical protein